MKYASTLVIMTLLTTSVPGLHAANNPTLEDMKQQAKELYNQRREADGKLRACRSRLLQTEASMCDLHCAGLANDRDLDLAGILNLALDAGGNVA